MLFALRHEVTDAIESISCIWPGITFQVQIDERRESCVCPQ